MGAVLAPFLIAALILGPAVAILNSQGPSLATRIAWAALSLTAVIAYVGMWRYTGQSTSSVYWAEDFFRNTALINTSLYVFPFVVFAFFRGLNSTSIDAARSSAVHSMDYRRVRSLRRQVHISMSLFAILILVSSVLDGPEVTAYFMILFVPLYFWVAISVGRLASAIEFNGVMWGIICIVLPFLGMVFAYLFVGMRSARYTNETA